MHWPHSLKREKNNLLCGYLSQRIGFSKPCCWRLERHCHGRTKGSLETHRMHYLQVLYTLTELLGTTPVFITFLFCSYIFFFLSYLVSYFSWIIYIFNLFIFFLFFILPLQLSQIHNPLSNNDYWYVQTHTHTHNDWDCLVLILSTRVYVWQLGIE